MMSGIRTSYYLCVETQGSHILESTLNIMLDHRSSGWHGATHSLVLRHQPKQTHLDLHHLSEGAQLIAVCIQNTQIHN